MLSNHLERNLVFSTIYGKVNAGSYVLIYDMETKKLIKRVEMLLPEEISGLMSYNCRFVPPNILVVSYSGEVRTLNIKNEKQEVIYKSSGIDNNDKVTLRSIYGLDFIDLKEKKIMLYSDTSGNVACQELESEKFVYSGKFFKSESRDIISLKNEKEKFCCCGFNKVQIHDIVKKERIIDAFTLNIGYNAGLCEIPKFSLLGVGCHYGKYIQFLDPKSKDLKRIGMTEAFGNIHRLEYLNYKVFSSGYIRESGTYNDEGLISIHDIRNYQKPLFSKRIGIEKIDSLQILDESRGILGFAGEKKSFFVGVGVGEDEDDFSESFSDENIKDLDIGRGSKRNPEIIRSVGFDSNVSVTRLRYLKLSKADLDERKEYIKENYLDIKEYRVRLNLKNTVILCYRFLLFRRYIL